MESIHHHPHPASFVVAILHYRVGSTHSSTRTPPRREKNEIKNKKNVKNLCDDIEKFRDEKILGENSSCVLAYNL